MSCPARSQEKGPFRGQDAILGPQDPALHVWEATGPVEVTKRQIGCTRSQDSPTVPVTQY